MVKISYKTPPVRRLRVYAFDPQASTNVDTADFNIATIELPWENAELKQKIEPGPVNSYFEVIDFDPASNELYEPINLNHPYLLAQDGLTPSEGDPGFHQQMVFAIAMKTVLLFERALGRTIFWSSRDHDQSTKIYRKPVYKLRIYPHALREANAYYSRDKKALLFGYFPSESWDPSAKWVFSALSHDVIAHETTHAILDGLHPRYAEATNIDSMAFHEAFADIVAMMSHFMLTEAVSHQIASQGGRLDGRSLMSGLATQFGKATGRNGALREAYQRDPDPKLLATLTEPHDRGSILLAAVFDAFVTIYQRRTTDLLRIANIRIEPGKKQELHPDLVKRLTREACKAADHILRMCIRALDYMPPVDIRFGEFLRAIITADYDLVPVDPYGYRLVMIEAFRRRGIYPTECLSLAVDSLLWERPDDQLDMTGLRLDLDARFIRNEAYERAESNRVKTAEWMRRSDGRTIDKQWQKACGVIFRTDACDGKVPQTVARRPDKNEGAPKRYPSVDVHSVRTTRRVGPDGQDIRHLIIEITQKRRGFLTKENQEQQDAAQDDAKVLPAEFTFRGGATLIFDLKNRELRYVIRKRIDNNSRLDEQREFLNSADRSGMDAAMYCGSPLPDEPFDMVHQERWKHV